MSMSLSSTQQKAIDQSENIWEVNEIAEGLCKAKDLDNARLVYLEAIKKAIDTSDYVNIADSVVDEDNLNDHDFGREIYQLGLDSAVESSNYREVADSVVNEYKLNDKDWGREIYKKGLESACSFDNLKNFADSIASNLDDKDWAREIYKKAENRAFEACAYENLADTVLGDAYLNDKDWAIDLFKKGLDIAHSSDSILSLARSIGSQWGSLKDKKWARKIIELAYDKAKTKTEVENIAEYYARELDDKTIAKDIYHKAVEISREYSDYQSLAGSVLNEDHLNDSKWAKELYENAVEKAISLDHLEYIADDIGSDHHLNDAAFSEETRKMDNPILTAAVEKKLSEEIQEMVEDADDLYEIRDTADELCNSDKKSAKKIYELCESLSYTPNELTSLAGSVMDEDYLNDKDWAIDLFKKAIDKALDADEMRCIAVDIADEWNGLNDKKWSKDIFTKSIELAHSFDEFKSIGDSIISDSAQNDKEWGRKVYETAKGKAQTAYDYLDLARAYADEDKLNDNKTAKELLEIAIERSDEGNDQFCDIANTIAENRYLGNKDWARDVYQMALDIVSDTWNYCTIADSISNEDYLNDKEWAREIFQLAVEKAKNQDDLDSIADSVENEFGFNDPKWAKQIRAGKGGSTTAPTAQESKTEPNEDEELLDEILDDLDEGTENASVADNKNEKPAKGKRASGKKGFTVSGRMSVGRFEEEFNVNFNVNVQVKKGGRYAPDDATLASLRPDNFKGPKKVDFSVRGNMNVGRVKRMFNDFFRLNLQLYDGNKVASDGQTLASIRKN